MTEYTEAATVEAPNVCPNGELGHLVVVDVDGLTCLNCKVSGDT